MFHQILFHFPLVDFFYLSHSLYLLCKKISYIFPPNLLLICSFHSVLSPLPFPSIFPHHPISSRHLPFPRIVLLIFPFHPIPSTLLFPPILLLVFPFHPIPIPLPVALSSYTHVPILSHPLPLSYFSFTGFISLILPLVFFLSPSSLYISFQSSLSNSNIYLLFLSISFYFLIFQCIPFSSFSHIPV